MEEQHQKFDYFYIEIYYSLIARKFFKLSFYEYHRMIMPYIQHNNETQRYCYTGVISNFFEIQSFLAIFFNYNLFNCKTCPSFIKIVALKKFIKNETHLAEKEFYV